MKIILYTGDVIICRKIEISMFKNLLIVDDAYSVKLEDIYVIIENKGGLR